MSIAALPGLESVSAEDLSFVLAFLREHCFTASEGALMGELERRILAAAPPSDDAPGATEAPAGEEPRASEELLEWCASAQKEAAPSERC